MASANKSVVVLAPNGRRQTVKVTPNTTILQILEEVCKKQGLKASEYDLKHHKNVLDTTIIIRFSGLPNNAQLEIVAAQRERQEGQVTLGVQLETGDRFTGDFSPSDTVFNVVQKLCPNELQDDTVVIYMRNEICGVEALKNTNLRSLGLTGGRAMLRLMHRTQEQLKTQANVSTVLPSKPTEEQPYIRKMIKTEEKKSTGVSRSTSPPKKQIENKNLMTELIRQEKQKKKKQTNEPMDVDRTIETSQKKGKKEPAAVTKEKRKEIQSALDNLTYLGDRHAVAFSLEQSEALPHEELPDEFFELTIQDAKKLYKDLKSKREELEERPLHTAALRNLEKEKRLLRHINQYGRAVIRVQFPDRSVLQGTFRPLETIKHVHDFIREYLHQPDSQFYLYITPPKTILSEEKTLVDCECVPSAVLYFGTNQTVENNQYLKEELFSKFVSPSVASLSASKAILKNKREIEPEAERCKDGDDVNVGASTSKAVTPVEIVDTNEHSTQPRPTLASEEPKSKVPKWFKPNK